MKRTAEEAAQTRQTILDAALTLFVKRGVAHTTLNEIAKAAGFTRGAVYGHFGSKDAILEELLRESSNLDDAHWQQAESASASHQETLARFIELHFKSLDSDARRRMLEELSLLHDADSDSREQRANDLQNTLSDFEAFFRSAKRANELRKGLSPGSAAKLVLSTLFGFELIALQNGDSFKREAKNIQTLFKYGIWQHSPES